MLNIERQSDEKPTINALRKLCTLALGFDKNEHFQKPVAKLGQSIRKKNSLRKCINHGSQCRPMHFLKIFAPKQLLDMQTRFRNYLLVSFGARCYEHKEAHQPNLFI